MTEPAPVMEQAEQDRLTRQVGRALLTVAGDGWTEVRAEYRSAGRHIEVDVFVTGQDGAPRPVRPPQPVVEGLGALRQGMYRPGRGTWLAAIYVLQPPSSFSAEFEPDAEPRWRRVPPPIGFADELRFFPRGDEYLPDWLRLRAGLPPRPQPPAGEPGAPTGQAASQAGSAPVPPAGPPAPPSGPPTPPGGRPAPDGLPPGPPTPPHGRPMPDGAPTPPRGTPPVPPHGGPPPPPPVRGYQPPPPPGTPPRGGPAPMGPSAPHHAGPPPAR